MSLDQGRLVEAIELLKSPEVMKQFHDQAKDSSGESSPLKIDLKGLVSMHAPQSTSILYAEPIDASQRLHSFCVSLQELFRSKGFLVPDSRPLKLHATIINTIYAKGNTKKPARQKFDSSDPGAAAGKLDDRSRGHGPNAKAPIKLDALSVIEKYKGYVWAEDFALDRIAICEMGAKKVLDIQGNIVEERYTEVAHVNLPT
jgi:activating signal cointegrator complex subunit 1